MRQRVLQEVPAHLGTACARSMSGRGRTGYPQSVAIDVTLLLFSVLSCIAVIIIFGMFYR